METILVNPPSPFLSSDKVFPYLGVLNVATYHNLPVLDLTGDKDYLKRVKDYARDSRFTHFGVTSTTPQFPYAYKILRAVKEVNPRLKVSIGGPHPTFMVNNRYDQNWERLNHFDFVVMGEAEQPFNFDRKHIHLPMIKDLDSLPIPDRSKLDIRSYHYDLDGKELTTILTQRGCAFSCDFCSGRGMPQYRKVRQRSPEKVVEEMDYLNKKYGFSAFMWYDDEVNIKPSRLEELSKVLEKRPYIHRGFVRADMVVKHPETLDYMKRMGFVELGIGIESGSDYILDNINKGTNVRMNTQAVQMMKDKGFRVKAFTIVGLPGETYETAMQTKKWIKDNPVDGFDITICTPYPGSRIYDQAEKSDIHKDFPYHFKGLFFKKPDFSQEQSFYKGIPGKAQSLVRTRDLSSEDIVKLREEIACT